MKPIVKWILFVPVCVLSVVLAVFNCIAPQTVSSMFSTNSDGIAKMLIFAVLGVFFAMFIFSLFERKISPVHLLKKNYFSGVFALLSAFALAANIALDVTAMIRTGDFDVMAVITTVFSVLTAVALLFIGLNHFSGANTPRAIGVFYLSIPLWCGVHLISRFLEHTASPVAAGETMDLIMFVALAMFAMYAMMIHSQIPGKNAVKSAITFGFPTVMICLIYGLTLMLDPTDDSLSGVLAYLPGLTYVLIGIYALSFTAELSFCAKTNEEQMVLEAEADADQAEDEDGDYEGDEEAYEKEKLSEDVSSEVSKETEEESYGEAYTPSEPAVRVVADSDDALKDLYSQAQQRDKSSKADSDSIATGSDDDMIIEGETERVVPQAKAPSNSDKASTVREAIMIEDDFILSIDDNDVINDNGYNAPKTSSQPAEEDISAYILEKTVPDADKDGKSGSEKYASRLDEIDRLIISIQGGETGSSEEDKNN
ncbi:MAG: hypothetical protein ACI4GZ_00190 [Ruminococcus sp.]